MSSEIAAAIVWFSAGVSFISAIFSIACAIKTRRQLQEMERHEDYANVRPMYGA